MKKSCMVLSLCFFIGFVAHAASYSRSEFGHGWSDDDKDCQNMRAEVLIKTSLSSPKFKTNKRCSVVQGRWNSMFTGNTLYNASELDIDHILPLKKAWLYGADTWSKAKRVKFANDPINLIAVEARLNRQKGAKSPLTWLPPQNQCQYVSRYLRILKLYDFKLPVSQMKQYKTLHSKVCAKTNNSAQAEMQSPTIDSYSKKRTKNW